MSIIIMQRRLIAAICTTASLLVFFNVTAFSQTASPQLKKGSRLPAPPSAPENDTVERLIITPHPSRGGKLSAQLANGDQSRLSVLANASLGVERKLSGSSHLIRLAQPLTIAEARALSAKLRDSGEIESAEPDLLMKAEDRKSTRLNSSH